MRLERSLSTIQQHALGTQASYAAGVLFNFLPVGGIATATNLGRVRFEGHGLTLMQHQHRVDVNLSVFIGCVYKSQAFYS
jgi:hypothetical protein